MISDYPLIRWNKIQIQLQYFTNTTKKTRHLLLDKVDVEMDETKIGKQSSGESKSPKKIKQVKSGHSTSKLKLSKNWEKKSPIREHCS